MIKENYAHLHSSQSHVNINTPIAKELLMSASIIQTIILTLIGLSVTACRISEEMPRPDIDSPAEPTNHADLQDTHDDNAGSEASVAESAGAASSEIQQCEVGEDCSTGQYCDTRELVCRPECSADNDCDDDEVCDSVSQQCIDPELLSPIEDPRTGITWVYIPAGTLMMGSEDFDDEQPVHRVTVQGFQMSETEVTVGQYRRCVEAGPCRELCTHSWCTWSDLPGEKEDHPVNFMTWGQARTFTKWAGGELPTEAQWEYAARGGEDTEYAGSNTIDEVSWWIGNAGLIPEPVKTRKANGYGLYDMSGNIAEWTLDLWHDDYVGAPDQAEIPWGSIPECDQTCDALRAEVVTRGGSVGGSESMHRVKSRWRKRASRRSNSHGIRVCRPLP